ncbi:LysR family transcriptional regulator [Dyella sp. M7H15-1]|uniref:LysR substrate-binding domain-containing protein n=1 Tax=Dyella sp. M7H15-1 TaxID=2501295 RepID=UPI001004F879|nr:LysR substrate-binding domain-containing protein [Dyella sp. M7H15-1]QAU23098.1 LysR family transcriptional regulator [Dyella sp. M7H15-1]
MFDFRQLRYFIAVAEELSFTRAAQRLHLSQPPLSQQIQALEHDLGICLLKRDKRNVTLTEPGKLFLEHARQILAMADDTRIQVAEAAAGYSGHLRLAYTVSVSFHPALPKILISMGQNAPNVRIWLSEMYTQPQFAAIRLGQIDAGLVRDMPSHEDDAYALRMDVIDREPLLLALPEDHRLAGREQLELVEVAGEPFVIQPRELAATLYDRLVQLAAKAGFHPVVRQQAQQLNGLLALVAAGIGLALVPASMQVVKLAGVSYVPLADPDAYLLLAVASRADGPMPVVSQFLETVAAAKTFMGL